VKCDHDVCWYCEMPLGVRHEHDHVRPKRHDGELAVPTCLNCHDLKDRIPLADWPADAAARAFLAVPPGLSRVLVAKLYAIAMDAERELEWRDNAMRGAL